MVQLVKSTELILVVPFICLSSPNVDNWHEILSSFKTPPFVRCKRLTDAVAKHPSLKLEIFAFVIDQSTGNLNPQPCSTFFEASVISTFATQNLSTISDDSKDVAWSDRPIANVAIYHHARCAIGSRGLIWIMCSDPYRVITKFMMFETSVGIDRCYWHRVLLS